MNFIVEKVRELPSDWREIVIFDLDGVLVDNTERLRESLSEVAEKYSIQIENINECIKNMRKYGLDSVIQSSRARREFWNTFLSEKYIHLDKPREVGIELLNEAVGEGKYVIILSGRTDNLLEATRRQLRDFNIHYDMLVMRKLGVFAKDHEFKLNFINNVLDGKVYKIHDDSPRVIMELSRNTNVTVLRLIKHIGNTWYNYPTLTVEVTDSNKTTSYIHTSKLREIIPKLKYPVTIKWMWISRVVHSADVLKELLENIEKIFHMIESLDNTHHSHEDLSEKDILEVEVTSEEGKRERWRVPNTLPELLLNFYQEQWCKVLKKSTT